MFLTELDDEFLVLGDAMRMRQILLNLIGNAIKFTDAGSVTVELEWQNREEASGDLVYRIADTGCGISKDEQESIFERFRQASGTGNRAPAGTGLGLAICRDLTEKMDGIIECESTPDVGSCFTVTIPTTKHSDGNTAADTQRATTEVKTLTSPLEEEAPQILSGSKSTTDELNILLAEDNAVNQLFLTTLMERFGWSVQLAENGRLALEALDQNAATDDAQFDLAFLDIRMPEMDGIEAATKIRARTDHYRDLPIIAITAHVFEEEREHYRRVGMNGHVAKPVDTEQMLTEVKRVLAGHVPTLDDKSPQRETAEQKRGLRAGLETEIEVRSKTETPGTAAHESKARPVTVD